MTTLYLLVLVFPIVTNAIRWGNLIHRKEFSTIGFTTKPKTKVSQSYQLEKGK